VPKDADEATITKAYKKLARIHHPDRHAKDDEDEKNKHEKKFKEINEAQAILTDK